MFKHPQIQAQHVGNSEASNSPRKKHPHEFFFFGELQALLSLEGAAQLVPEALTPHREGAAWYF